MNLTKKFDYTAIERETQDNGIRHYLVDGKPLPSVTTILSSTKNLEQLNKWRKRVGEEEADRIVKESVQIGTAMHKNIENYILEGTKPVGSAQIQLMSQAIIKRGLKKVDEIWGVEVPLFCKDLYAGTSDMVGVIQEPCIIDFKNSKDLKKEKYVEDYKLQLAAYSMAHNEMFNTTIKKGVIMIATRNFQYQEFVIEGDDFRKSMDEWAKRLEMYYLKN